MSAADAGVEEDAAEGQPGGRDGQGDGTSLDEPARDERGRRHERAAGMAEPNTA